MPPRLRLALAVLALFLVACALLALSYALWPLQDASWQSTLPATLLTPP